MRKVREKALVLRSLFFWFDRVIIIGVGIRRRRIARRKRSLDRIVESGLPDPSFLRWRVLMPLGLVGCHERHLGLIVSLA
jgi:hypothetical protein